MYDHHGTLALHASLSLNKHRVQTTNASSILDNTLSIFLFGCRELLFKRMLILTFGRSLTNLSLSSLFPFQYPPALFTSKHDNQCGPVYFVYFRRIHLRMITRADGRFLKYDFLGEWAGSGERAENNMCFALFVFLVKQIPGPNILSKNSMNCQLS